MVIHLAVEFFHWLCALSGDRNFQVKLNDKLLLLTQVQGLIVMLGNTLKAIHAV